MPALSLRDATWLRQHLAGLRALLVLTVITGLVYPLAVFAVAQLPGLRERAQGSLRTVDGTLVGSSLIGQSFTGADGAALPGYFQSRPSVAGDGYDPLSTAASNLGPEDVVDTASRPSLLSTVCARSKEVGDREGVTAAARSAHRAASARCCRCWGRATPTAGSRARSRWSA